ncbi:MAG TPA: NADH-quinone oxidoreductase subunit C [Propionibacteriaceae bacterium]|nr:NADH-quinone oxidoreductase subunit C [Propionibacteriaceae bacterium]
MTGTLLTSAEVDPADWLTTLTEARADGCDYFDWLGCSDDIGRTTTFHVTVLLRDLSHGRALMLTTAVPRDEPVLDSIRTVFPGAGWHERESAELFGIRFRGGDSRRLLLSATFEGVPLRKEEVLGARAVVDWPGAKEPGESDASPSRRRMAPPGVPDPELWGNRDRRQPPAEPADVAAATAGGRVRRRGR